MTTEPSCLAVIPARGGSKRLPRKNVLPFNGRPIIEYTIEAALESGCFERVVVSSDDDEILRVAGAAGAEVDRRSDELGSDTATVVDVCRDLIRREQALGRSFDRLAALYATSPMRSSEDIRRTIGLLDHPGCDFAIAATRYPHYAHQALSLHDDDFVEPCWPELYTLSPREVGPVACGNGSTYCVDVRVFMETGSFVGQGTRAYMMPIHRSVDIDTMEEFELAQFLAGVSGDQR